MFYYAIQYFKCNTNLLTILRECHHPDNICVEPLYYSLTTHEYVTTDIYT